MFSCFTALPVTFTLQFIMNFIFMPNSSLDICYFPFVWHDQTVMFYSSVFFVVQFSLCSTHCFIVYHNLCCIWKVTVSFMLLCSDRSGYNWRYRWVPNMAWLVDNLFPNDDHDLVPVWAEKHNDVWTQHSEAQFLPSFRCISIGLVHLPAHHSTYCTASISSLEVQTAAW